jgi:hypothetical protein
VGRSDVADLTCNECGFVLKTVPVADLRRTQDELHLSLDVATAKCPHCGNVNLFPGCSRMLAYICPACRPVGQPFRTVKRCIVTAIAPNGRRSTIEVEAKSRNHAAILFNYQATSDHTLIRPDADTLFEITPADGETLRTTWRRVMDWANAQGARSNARR